MTRAHNATPVAFTLSDGGELNETQVWLLGRIAAGALDSEIAAEGHYARTTIKSLLYSIYNVLGARNRPHAVFIATQLGVLDGQEVDRIDRTNGSPRRGNRGGHTSRWVDRGGRASVQRVVGER